MAYPQSSARPAVDQDTYAEVDAQLDSEQSNARRHTRSVSLSSLTIWSERILLVALFMMPLLFGAVHFVTGLASQIVFFSLAAVLILKEWPTFVGLYGRKAHSFRSRRVFLLLGATCCYVAVQPLILAIDRPAHPIVGELSWFYNPVQLIEVLREYCVFLTLFCTTQVLCALDREFFKKSVRTVAMTVGVVAFVALSHWLYDNGRLFWIFEPEHFLGTNRARWPFVSSNSLGQFLVLLGFPLLGLIVAHVTGMIDSAAGLANRRKDAFAALLSRRRQRKLAGTALDVVLLLSVVVALSGSLSRGSWLGASLALLLLAVLLRLSKAAQPDTTAAPSLRRRRTRDANRTVLGRLLEKLSSAQVSRYVSGFIISMALVGVMFFLNEQGREVVAERIEFGLHHSRDDVRWQFYSDSLELLSKNPLFGIGAGNFAERFPEVSSPLAGALNVGFLHSDPLQCLIELGMFGGLIVVGAGLVLFLGGIRMLLTVNLKGMDFVLLGLVCGLFALLIASLIDMPFRVPAISSFFAVQLALACYYIDERQKFVVDAHD